jgi:hypothetical protein
MHHRKRGARIPWCGWLRYEGRPEIIFGTVYTSDFDPREARRLLNESAAEVLPPGFTVGHIERGALIYRPAQEREA